MTAFDPKRMLFALTAEHMDHRRMTIDKRTLEKMRSHYACLTDEELAYISTTRSRDLTEEAQIALSEVVKARGAEKFETDIAAIRVEIAHQGEVAKATAERTRHATKLKHRFENAIAALVVVAGLLFALLNDRETGLLVAAGGVLFYVFLVTRRLLWRFIWAALKP